MLHLRQLLFDIHGVKCSRHHLIANDIPAIQTNSTDLFITPFISTARFTFSS